MGKIIISTLISILPFTQLSHPHEEDPFTTYIQEKLIELGYLEVANGVNDKTSQAAIKLFQEQSGLNVDGMVGEQTFTKLLLGESNYQTPETTSKQIDELNSPTIDTHAPVWDEEQPPYASEIGSLFNLNMPSVTDNVGIVSYEVYVNGTLSTYATISDSTLLVTPKYDMTCGDQFIYVIAFDEAGNSSQSPSFTIPQTDPCTSTVSSSQSSSTSQSSSSSQISSQSFAVNFGGQENDLGLNVVVDSLGNTYVTGQFRATVNFGNGNITSAGYNDIFVLKLDSAGAFQWVYTAGASNSDSGYGIALDSSGNVFITGAFTNTVNFGNGNITSTGNMDIFVLKLNSSGEFEWVFTVGGSSSDFPQSIDVDSSGNLYITGNFSGTVDFGSGNITSAGFEDIFVLKLNSSGEFEWVFTGGSTGTDRGNAISVDVNGNAVVTGFIKYVANFSSASCTSNGSSDIFFLKLNSDGTLFSLHCEGGTGEDFGNAVDLDSDGNAYFTGEFSGTVNFFGTEDITSEGVGSEDIFVVKLNSASTFQWVYTAGGNSDDHGLGIKVDSSGNSYITGYFSGTVNFGNGIIHTGIGSYDLYVLKLDSSGEIQWVYTAGELLTTVIGEGVDIDTSGNVYVTGYFYKTVDFGGGDVTAFDVSERYDYSDIFVLKLNSSGQYSD